jgi:hypothetical protein
MLKKQSIRSIHKIFLNKNPKPAEKDEIIALSEFWSENEEILFRKLLKQGGSIGIKGTHFKVVVQEKMRRLKDM